MSDEITHNFKTGQTLYSCYFKENGNVFVAGALNDEVWGTGSRDADDYDQTMTEEDGSGHYKGDFALGGTIAEGTYNVAVYHQQGGSPADSDPAIAQGVIYWDGSAEIDRYTINLNVEEGAGRCLARRQAARILKYLQRQDGTGLAGPTT
jgi:hypothetical protein